MIRKLFEKCIALSAPGFGREIERRNARRVGTSSGWFTPEEAVVAEALAKLIVPGGNGSPGIEDICASGENAAKLVEKVVAESSNNGEVYARGLLAFDYWALSKHGRQFVGLSTEEQAALFRCAQERHENRAARTSVLARMRRGLEAIIHAKKGILYAELLYPVIRNDCLRIFYTSAASWAWLQYDGPPMDDGYCSLTQPRLSDHIYG
jgi:hypothetical protein